MESNNIDKVFKSAFEKRSLTPSPSAWERLEKQLETPRKKKNISFQVLRIAAGIAILFTVGYFLYSTQETAQTVSPIENTVVIAPEELPIKKPVEVQQPILQNIDTTEIESTPDYIVQKTSKPVQNNLKTKPVHISVERENTELVLAEYTTAEIEKVQIKNNEKPIEIKSIRVDATALLNSIEKSISNENNTQKKNSIQKNINVDASEMLTAIEDEINEQTFKEKFMKTVKNNITNITTAIADRNK